MASDEKPLKSAYELAMERLREKDRERGEPQARPLTRAQKDEIARLREEARAKLAETEILHRDRRAAATDPEQLAELEERFRVDRRRIESSLESAIARVRRGRSADAD